LISGKKTHGTIDTHKAYSIEKNDFGEGSTRFNDKIYMLTWTSRKVYVFNNDLSPLMTLKMPDQMKEGWGLTHDSQYIYATDGTASIFTIDPDSFTVINQITVRDELGN
jgi:glutamine cyclotransferase